MNDGLTTDIVELDALLRSAARAFVYPPTPAMAVAVTARLREPGPSVLGGLVEAVRGWWRRPLPRAAIAAVMTALVVLGAALAIPQSRTALADFFGLSHVRVDEGPSVGPLPPVLSPESFAAPVFLADAQDAIDFLLRFPTKDGARLDPAAVYLQGGDTSAPAVIFVYEAFDLYQTRAGFFGKGGPDLSLIHEIEFGGQPALWIDEGGHIASFMDEEGRLVVESRRTVARATLLWERDGVTYRLETVLSQEEAIRAAESLR